MLAAHPAAPGSNPSIPQKNSDGKIIDVAEVNQRSPEEESGLCLKIVD